IRAGYAPWDDRHGAGTGAALFQTCTRMYRADYCGDGIGWTRNGMTIDTYDIHGIQRPEDPATLPFEAGWGPDGATCVHPTRVKERGGLAALHAQCPRLAHTSAGAECTPDSAGPALMFNRSHDERP
ncbi:MAG TPA: ADYC domain-containing protein, partial [Geminicoccaceae bacterium]